RLGALQRLCLLRLRAFLGLLRLRALLRLGALQRLCLLRLRKFFRLPRLCMLLRLRTAPGLGLALLLDLPSHGFARPIAVVLGPDRSLLHYRARIARPGILSLVGRQRGRCLNRITVPLVPSVVLRRPALPPVIAPAQRGVGVPATEIRRLLAVITHR